MEPKKNPKKDLNRQRTLFLQIGLVFALAVVFLAFEWKTYEKVNPPWLVVVQFK